MSLEKARMNFHPKLADIDFSMFSNTEIMNFNSAKQFYAQKNYCKAHKYFEKILYVTFKTETETILEIVASYYMLKIIMKSLINDNVIFLKKFGRDNVIKQKNSLMNYLAAKYNPYITAKCITYTLQFDRQIDQRVVNILKNLYGEWPMVRILKFFNKNKMWNSLDDCINAKINNLDHVIALNKFSTFLTGENIIDSNTITTLRLLSSKNIISATIFLANYFKSKKTDEYVTFTIVLYKLTQNPKYRNMAANYSLKNRFYSEYCSLDNVIQLDNLCVTKGIMKRECPICYDEIDCHMLECNHPICNSCFQSLIASKSNTCPCCRANISFK